MLGAVSLCQQDISSLTERGDARRTLCMPLAGSEATLCAQQFASHMCHVGDQLFIGRYLTNGAEASSLYAEVRCSHSTGNVTLLLKTLS